MLSRKRQGKWIHSDGVSMNCAILDRIATKACFRKYGLNRDIDEVKK